RGAPGDPVLLCVCAAFCLRHGVPNGYGTPSVGTLCTPADWTGLVQQTHAVSTCQCGEPMNRSSKIPTLAPACSGTILCANSFACSVLNSLLRMSAALPT